MAMVSNLTEKLSQRQHGGAMNRLTRRWRLIVVATTLVAAVLAAPFVWRAWVDWRYAPSIFTPEEAPAARVALVLGARVYPSGRLSAMLRDRVDTAVALYQAGKVDKLVMSGARGADYDEPGAMRARAIELGVPATDIQLDYGGLRTYDSCYRASEIYRIEEAIVVTQQFHLPRALFLCESLGVRVVGVPADQRVYSIRSLAWSELREVPATALALVDVLRRQPPPILGEITPLD
ncbi:MAG TPA: hypothetical protein DCL15_15305 [Chloroflexi bacterium]|nr:hypothetical protein [Chloroflexota bacterium]